MSNKKINFKTPQGICQYPWLNHADTQFDHAGQYKCNLRLSEADAKPLMEEVRNAAKDAFGDKAKSATLPFGKDEETGEVVIKTKSKFQPAVCDSQGKVIPSDAIPNIFGGSEVKLAGNLYAYNAGGRHGISMQLGAVQLIKLSEGASGAVQFGSVEGGFVAANDNEANGDGQGSYNF